MSLRRSVCVGFVGLVCWFVAPAVARAQPKLEIVSVWASESHAEHGDGVVVKATIRNAGSTTLRNVRVSLGGSDHFNFFGPLCGSGLPDGRACSDDALAPGEELTDTFAAEVCCFPKGEIRGAWLTVFASADDGGASAQASLPVWIVGPHD